MAARLTRQRVSKSFISGISGETKIIGVFGYPVEHSLSPAMHNAAIAALRLHYAYIPFSIRPGDIGSAIRCLKTLGIIGINLTIPHKERVLPYLDEIVPEALEVGAVNTVHQVEGRLVGYNTDGSGFFAPLAARGFQARDKQAVVLGAGGAARSVVFRLAREGATVCVANRTIDRARDLAAAVNQASGRKAVEPIGLSDSAGLVGRIAGAELLVNTTSMGMFPNSSGIPPIPLDEIRPGMIVYDLVYNPIETELLKAARTAGADTIDGVQMLVHQGAAAFKIWTGIDPPTDVMEQAVLKGLSH